MRQRKLYKVGKTLECVCDAMTAAEVSGNRTYRGKLSAIRRLAGKPIRESEYDTAVLTSLEILSELGRWHSNADMLSIYEEVMISTLALFASSVQIRNERAYAANDVSIGKMLGKIALRKKVLNGGVSNVSDDTMMRQIIKADDLRTISHIMLRAVREYDGAVDYAVLGDDICSLLTRNRDIALQRISKDYIGVLSSDDKTEPTKERD